ncbi:ABC transporter [Nocardiopsis sp. CC223A]|uniref:ABC transporter n=1 Tax=Nocardiopsis sp. CC223A TaxID=3044051 RepID=UPI00278C10E0|nr:ABC transporter [Nocardiopsis sp. CC223A]
MTRTHRTGRLPASGAGLLAAALLAGCGPAPQEEPAPDAEPTPHGYVEGAEETAEPQSRLVLADDEGRIQVLDLITEESTLLDPVGAVDGITGDGRFAYLTSSDQRTTSVVDSGAWTVDHGDHYHYYRAEIRPAGTVPGATAAGAATDTALTALNGTDGTVALLDRPALEDGDAATAAVPATTGLTVPYAERLIVAEDGPVHVLDREGDPVETLDEECADPRAWAVTRRGLVLGCADGALVITEDDGALTAEPLPHPDGLPADAAVTRFHHRPGAAALAAVPAPDTVLVLDLVERRWDHWELPGVVTVTAVGEGASVLALTEDGALHALDPATGGERARTDLLEQVDAEHPPTLQVDTSRAYVNDVHTGRVHEIDYNDDLRVARTFDTEVAPHHMVETGR